MRDGYDVSIMFTATTPVELAPDFWLLSNYVSNAAVLLDNIEQVTDIAPFRHMQVPGGKQMAVGMSNCGALGWTSNAQAYAYTAHDPMTQLPWPRMPEAFMALARDAAAAVGWQYFVPDACLINRYAAGAGLGLHQDRDERDHSQPIVSVSIGESCKFMLGGLQRSDPVRSITLNDGDVMVWGGRARLIFHGVRPLPVATKSYRYNLTFRKAG